MHTVLHCPINAEISAVDSQSDLRILLLLGLTLIVPDSIIFMLEKVSYNTVKPPLSWFQRCPISCSVYLYNVGTLLYSRQFSWSQRYQTSYNPYLYNTDTSVIRNLSSVLLVSLIKSFNVVSNATVISGSLIMALVFISVSLWH